jgi:lysophospholipase L1-like esterase
MRIMILAALAMSLGACASTPEPPERLVYLAIGASDAAGVGAEPLTNGYVFRIADELDERIDKVFLVPLAIPAAGTEQLDAALERLFDTPIEPGLVTVWTGANDIIQGEDVDDFEDELEDMFERPTKTRHGRRFSPGPLAMPLVSVHRPASAATQFAIQVCSKRDCGNLLGGVVSCRL